MYLFKLTSRKFEVLITYAVKTGYESFILDVLDFFRLTVRKKRW